MTERPDIVVFMTDQERAAPPYETSELTGWRDRVLTGRRWFDDHGVAFRRHYTGSLACVPSRPTIFTGQFPDVHGVTQTDGLGKTAEDSRMRWLRSGEVPTLGHWFRAGGYDTHYDGKWHITHADLVDEKTGKALATNDDDGVVDPAAVQAYLDADRLDEFGFSGWVGPEPHGALLADSVVRRDPLIADPLVAWLDDRYARRAAGDEAAQRPFLLVASFVNPHDVALFPAWAGRGNPLSPSELDPPPVPAAPTADEDLASKPAAQVAYRAAYPTGYGPARFVTRLYDKKGQQYRDLYHRLQAEGDGSIDRVRRAVTDGGADTMLLRTSDHGDLLGAHGGLHQKWFNLYDEATRVPFTIVRVGAGATTAKVVDDAPTSHVDIVPTLLAAASIDEAATAATLRDSFSEVHPLPGRNLMPVVDSADEPDRDRTVYLITRDNILEGDSAIPGLIRKLGKETNPPAPLQIHVPAHVAANFEGLVSRVDEGDAPGGGGRLWKLVRTFDDPATWTEPFVRHLAASGPGGEQYRTEPLADQWELYDLDADPVEAENRWNDGAVAAVFALLAERLEAERARSVPERNEPWPYESRHPIDGPPKERPRLPARALRKLLHKVGMHPDDDEAVEFDLAGKRALVIATNHGVLDVGKPTGVFASEMTVPYYAFLDAGMHVDVASPKGGTIPVDPQSLKSVLRTEADDRFLADDRFRAQVGASLPVGELDMAGYDIVYLAGGWGAAFDFGFSDALAAKVTEANALGKVIGGVCHGPLGLINATGDDGAPLVAGRHVTAVTDKQVRELGIESTPHHPEAELRKKGADFESETKFRDPLANHWVTDGNLVTGQNQNAAPMVAREMMQLVAAGAASPSGATTGAVLEPA